MDCSVIKLIIWDLDETLWQGILSEGNVIFPDSHQQLIKNMVDCGVMASLCSKNDHAQVQQQMEESKLWDLFVFPSINWSPKGERVKQIITAMNLRPVNVLFVDDNPFNRNEVEAACNGIIVAKETCINELIDYYARRNKSDIEHKRLQQYKILERKQEFRAKQGSNAEFLKKSNIQVEISDKCLPELVRIADLVMRSNQLNFTKNRMSQEELLTLMQDETVQTGYVRVRDSFGDYGIVGFFAIAENRLIHFVFSCRTLGMGIEQFVYRELGRPDIAIVGEVSSELNSPDPVWINQSKNVDESNTKANVCERIVIKGPCDMSQMFAYIQDNQSITTEFVYTNDEGIAIEQGNHTVHIVESRTIDKKIQKKLCTSLPFGDAGMFETKIFDDDIDFVVLSMLTDPNLGLYRDKESGAIVAFGEYTNDLTDSQRWDQYVGNKVYLANCKMTYDFLQKFSREFEYVGRVTQETILQNLQFIRDTMRKEAILVLVLGSELEYKKNRQAAYADRHIYHKRLNAMIREWSKTHKDIKLIDINEFINGQESYTDNINHFVRHVYYQISKRVIELLNKGEDSSFKVKNPRIVWLLSQWYRIKTNIKKVVMRSRR